MHGKQRSYEKRRKVVKNKRRIGRRNGSNNRDQKKSGGLEYRKNSDTATSSLASIFSFWQQQYFPMRWNETYNEYVIYAKRMAQINEEFITRSQRMTQLYI